MRVPTSLSGIQRPAPFLQFICIISYLEFNSLRAGEGGPHSYANRAWANVSNLKTQGLSSNGRKFSSCKQGTPVLFQGQGGGWVWGRQGEEVRKQAYSQVTCAWRLSTCWIPRILTVDLHAEPQELFLGRDSRCLKTMSGVSGHTLTPDLLSSPLTRPLLCPPLQHLDYISSFPSHCLYSPVHTDSWVSERVSEKKYVYFHSL